MGHGKETPRQKMIGMMYLFLTAMLALNVSKDVLDAFTMVDESLKETTSNFVEKNESVYTDFNVAYAENPTKVGPWKDKADEVKKRADSLVNLIQEYKIKIVKTADGPEGDVDHIKSKDNLDVPAQVMMVEKGGERGKNLKEHVSNFREYLLALVDTAKAPGVTMAIESSLDTSDPEVDEHQKGAKITWTSHHFEHLPLAGVVTLMSKMQSDVRNAEADIISYLYSQIDAGSFKFNKLEPVVNAKSNYVLKGGQFEAEIFIAASDTTKQPVIEVNGSEIPIEQGKGKYVAPANSVGPKSISGVIKYEGPNGVVPYPFESEYQVGQPSLVVSPTKMNVLFIGVQNPIEISVSGVPADRVQPYARGAGARLSSGGAGYYVTVSQMGEVTVGANIIQDDGSTKNMGSKKFRVARVPDPKAKVAEKDGGRINKQLLMAQTGIEAVLEDFYFDLTYKVTSFDVSANVGGYQQEAHSNSARFTQEQMGLIRSLTGGRVYIENIKAIGPDKQPRELSPIIFTLD